MFKDKVVVVTGGAHGIGQCICNEFRKEGAKVCVIDLRENDYFQGDLSDKKTLEPEPLIWL
jgi:NAD(P)-dependent dehydrogenase (short-subunit alcohol dehydrogenase family)